MEHSKAEGVEGWEMKILITENGSAVNTTHIANLFRVPIAESGNIVPVECDFTRLVASYSAGHALVAELVSGRFVLAEVLDSEELAEQTFWLLIAEMQYDSEPRMIRLPELRSRAFTPGKEDTPMVILDFSSTDFN